jgi:hypothetical protein
LRVCEELPPRHSRGAASSSITLAPASRAIRAAQRAALPPPITNTSTFTLSLHIDGFPTLESCCRLTSERVPAAHIHLLTERIFHANKANDAFISDRRMHKYAINQLLCIRLYAKGFM